ncbi:unnamed protein product [Malus baccata var. baccata]
MPDFSELSNMRELYLSHSCKLTEIPGLDMSLNSMTRVHMEGCINLTADFRKNILQGWTSCGYGGIFLNGNYIPDWFDFVKGDLVSFHIPLIVGRNFSGLTLCCIYSSKKQREGPLGIIVRNKTKRTALLARITCASVPTSCTLDDHYLWQGQISNYVLSLQGGDKVDIFAKPVETADASVRVKKTGVNLVWDKFMKENMHDSDLHLYDFDQHPDWLLGADWYEGISRELRSNYLDVAIHPVGIDSRVQEISNYLDVEGSNDVRIIGILGVGGLGKTTVAKAIFNKHHHSFDGASFLPNVREDKKLIHSQNKLLSDILRSGNKEVCTVDEGTKEIKRRLANKRVLVIVDNVDSDAQLNALAIKHDSFGPGSRIIITTRDQDLLKILKLEAICPVQEMNKEEALELLSWHAFKKNYPSKEYVELSRKAVGYCGGLPLALELLGSCLHTKSTSEWKAELDKLEGLQPYFTFNGMDYSKVISPKREVKLQGLRQPYFTFNGMGYSTGKSPRREVKLQGPRPMPLRVNKDSVKIKKPPVAPQPSQQPNQQQQPHHFKKLRQPVLIYTVSPKRLQSNPSDFMDLVQRLTGLPPSNSSSTALLPGNNNINPLKYDNYNNPPAQDDQGMITAQDVVEETEIIDDGVRQKGLFPGILSPGPASLIPIPSHFFPPPARNE